MSGLLVRRQLESRERRQGRLKAMLRRLGNRTEQQAVSEVKPWQFGPGGRDPVPAARKGGVKSGESRRLRSQMREQRTIEERILASRNGAAQAKLLEIVRRRHTALERAQIEAD